MADEWTIQTLKTYLETRIDEADRRYRERHEAAGEALAAALASSKEAVLKAEDANNLRLSEMNQFRAAMGDREREFMPRQECEKLLHALGARIDLLEQQRASATGHGTGEREVKAYLIGAIGLLLGIAALVVSLLVG